MAKAFVSKGAKIENSLKTLATIKHADKEIEVVALWDTGATNSCVSDAVVTSLGLIPTGYVPIRTPSGSLNVGTYSVDISLPNGVDIDGLMVCGSEIGKQGLGLLIGMDIISKGDFAVSNYNGKTVFSFRIPSKSTLDFVAGIRMANVMGATR